MAHQYMPKIFLDPHKNPPVLPPTYLMYGPLAETLYAIDKSSTIKCKFSDLPLLTLKFTNFHILFLEPRVQFFFKLCITLQCYER